MNQKLFTNSTSTHLDNICTKSKSLYTYLESKHEGINQSTFYISNSKTSSSLHLEDDRGMSISVLLNVLSSKPKLWLFISKNDLEKLINVNTNKIDGYQLIFNKNYMVSIDFLEKNDIKFEIVGDCFQI